MHDAVKAGLYQEVGSIGSNFCYFYRLYMYSEFQVTASRDAGYSAM